MNSVISLLLVCFSSLTLVANESAWTAYKNDTVTRMASLSGWCSPEKALLMMDLIKNNRFQTCVEIGVFAGRSLFPIARALQHTRSGKVYAIDAWNAAEAIKGFESSSDPNYIWWSRLDFTSLHSATVQLLRQHALNNYCEVVKKSAQHAAHMFSDETIDFIHFDGNHNEEIVVQDVVAYFPKIKTGGYILLNDPNWLSTKRALVFLLERTEIITPFVSSANYLLLRKSAQRIKIANTLMTQ